ncbi:MAG TPA: GIY-YIG nuclease family protein [Candidatus Dojkabacteria bacterium]|jgi:putative endonuclease
MFYVYFLKSTKEPNWVYVGHTTNIDRRVKEHRTGQNLSTRPYLPIILSSFIAVPTRIKAEELEKYFKKGSGKAILKKRILSDEAVA